jgi:hypothetical protein
VQNVATLVASKLVRLSSRCHNERTIVGQNRAYGERDAPARHPGGLDVERSRDNMERSATQSTALVPPLLLLLQRSAGNQAVVGLIQRSRERSGEARAPHHAFAPSHRLLQRAPWTNVPKRFRTDNGTGGVIPNSEYLVEATTYKRYAPINKFRAPGQVYHEGTRSVAYMTPGDAKAQPNAASATGSATAADDLIFLTSLDGQEMIVAFREPQEGLDVWDGEVENDGTVKGPHHGDAAVEGPHAGDAVTDLGGALETLGKTEKLNKVRNAHEALKAARGAGSALVDYDFRRFFDTLSTELILEKGVSIDDVPIERVMEIVNATEDIGQRELGESFPSFINTLALLIEL